jgi:asparaginyl-tRNA synthetase
LHQIFIMSVKIKALLKTAPEGQQVTVQGWVRTFRANRFIALNDGSTLGNLQCVVEFEDFDEALLKDVSTGAALKITGRYVESQGKGQAAEIQVEDLLIHGTADPESYPIQPKKHSFEFLREKAHLRVRTATFSAVMRVRAALSFGVHKFFREEGFHYVNTPIITGSDAEGAGEMFRVSALDAKNPPLDENGNVDVTQDFFWKRDPLDCFWPVRSRNLCHGTWRGLYLWTYFSC